MAHIINPFKAKPSSDLYITQPLTFESMRRAKRYAKGRVDVELYTAQFEEDREMIPQDFIPTQNLERSVLDIHTFIHKRKYPLIQDILIRLFNETEAEYLIYTNVDIILQPYFYQCLATYIREGYDALIVNRRRIPETYTKRSQLSSMSLELGKSHPGFDCFVFHRNLLSKFQLGEICIGVPFIGIGLSQNLFCYAENIKMLINSHLTLHIGMELFMKRAPKEYFLHNKHAFWKQVRRMWPEMEVTKLPYVSLLFPIRVLAWGLNPSIPIRLALALEWKRWKQRLGIT